MLRDFPIYLLFFFCIIAFTVTPCTADEGNNVPKNSADLELQYQRAKSFYDELHSTHLGKTRDNWLNGVRSFRKSYLSGPKSDFAAPSLYMLGRMYSNMYKRFKVDMDLNEALSYYRDVSSLFPESILADDALYAVGNLYLNKKNNPQRAAVFYSRIIADYSNGDMYPLASDKLKVLSKEQKISLPDAKHKHTSLDKLTYVLPVKYWSSADYTRVVIKTSGPVRFKERLLEKKGDKPRRLYLDFQGSYIDPKYSSPIPIKNGLLKQIRTGQFTPETVRVVLDIETISDYKIFSLPDPFRVIIDVRGETKDGQNVTIQSKPQITPHRAKSVKQVPPSQKDSGIEALDNSLSEITETITVLEDFKKYKVDSRNGIRSRTASMVWEEQVNGTNLSLAQQLGLGIRKIVIDPGHGGKDPGASAFGLKEKDLVLSIAKKLVPILEEQTGAEVILTRDSDVFISLEERTAIANKNDADIFISLHINAHPSPKVHGLETYYLNLTTNAEAMRVAAFENSTSTHQMSDLQDILSDIMKNSKVNESSRLAGFVHNSLRTGFEGVQKKRFKDLGVKQAPFYVLIGAEMPAVLLELAFLSNPEDSKILKTDSFLNIIANGISEGVQNYIYSTTVSLKQ